MDTITRRSAPALLLGLGLGVVVLAATVTAGCERAGSIGAGPVLLGNGVGTVTFGRAESSAIGALDQLLGQPTTRIQDQAGNCTTDAAEQWPEITAYFYEGRFVGYSTLAANGEPLPSAHLATALGLTVGDTLADAQRRYGAALTTSGAQGGSWFAQTADGRLEGYLTEEVGHTSPPPSIASIEAGSVGCPAATP